MPVAALYACKALACIALPGLSHDNPERQLSLAEPKSPLNGSLIGEREFA